MSALEAYLERSLPGYLRADAPAPEQLSADEWREIREHACNHWRGQAAADYAARLNAGWKVAELASGVLERGAQVSAVTGRVLRPAPSTFNDLAPKAARLLSELEQERVTLTGSLSATLGFIANGVYNGRRQTAEAVLRETENAVSAARTARELKAAEHAALKHINVLVPFRSDAGHWHIGEHAITEEQLDQLLHWQARHEAFAEMHEWEQPEGYPTWPPFVQLD